MRRSVTNSLKEEITTKYNNQLFAIKELTYLANYETIKRLIIRLENESFIVRVIDGIYKIPRYSKLTMEEVGVTPHELAIKIAENFSWKISPMGINALNILGVSNQIPTAYEYLSTGPHRTYYYKDKVIKFKNTRNSELNELSYKSRLVISAIKAIGKQKISKEFIAKIKENLNENEKERLLVESRKVTVWVYEIIKEICSND